MTQTTKIIMISASMVATTLLMILAAGPVEAQIPDAVAALLGIVDGLSFEITALEKKFAEQNERLAGKDQQIAILEGQITELNATLTEQTAPAITDSGDFIPFYYYTTPLSNSRTVQLYYENNLFLEGITTRLNQMFALPYDINIIMDECDGNAYYNSNRTEVVICYEFVPHIGVELSKYYDTADDLLEAVDHVVAVVILHEVGHALIDAYDLTITGKEEDAADQFATIVALEYIPIDEPGSKLFPTMFWWLALGQYDLDPSIDQFAGVHSFALQRYFNTVCWAYGSHWIYAPLLDILLENERYWCASEYKLAAKSWYELLSPFLINPESVPPPYILR